MSDFESGSKIGGYSLERQLGRGGFGSVWRAQHIATGRTVAMKVLDRMDDPSGSTTLLRHDIEILAGAAAQNSPHLVRVLEGGVDGVPFVVMEYVDGTDLGRQLSRLQRLPQEEVIRIGMGVADALGALHDLGIIHRDVKPANIMIDLRGVVKLTDFGIAKIVGYHSVSQTGQNPLSYYYAAPEVWSGMPSSASDIYAFGVVLWECLMGEPPFKGSPTELLYAHLNRAPNLEALPAEMVPSLRELLALCLSKAEDGRPADSHVCLEMLREADEEQRQRHALEVEIQKVEPAQFGSWIKGEPHATLPWAWHCTHREGGREAVVEIRFAPDVRRLNDVLRQAREAVRVNAALVALGAEELLDADRFLLRPNETWNREAPSQFPYLIARVEQEVEAATRPLTPEDLPATVDSLSALTAAADELGLPLNLSPEDVFLLADGSLYLRRPGLPVEGEEASDPMALLRALPMDSDATTIVRAAGSLAGVMEEIERREAERIEAERLEAARRELERLEAARREAERREQERLEAEQREAERREAERLEAERLEAERREAARLEAERLEVERREAEHLEAARLEAARLEVERLEAAQREAEQQEATRREAARLEAVRLEAVRADAARQEAEREAARLEAERAEAARREAARAEATRLEAERLEATRLEAERLAATRQAQRAEQAEEAPNEAATVLQSARPNVTMQLFQVDGRPGKRAGARAFDIVFVNNDDTAWTLAIDAAEATETGREPGAHAYAFTLPESVTVPAHSSAGVRLTVAPRYRRSEGEAITVPFAVRARIGERPVASATAQFEDVPAAGAPFWLLYAAGGMLAGFAGVVAAAMLLG